MEWDRQAFIEQVLENLEEQLERAPTQDEFDEEIYKKLNEVYWLKKLN